MKIIVMIYKHCKIVKKIGLEYQMYKKHNVIVEVYKYSMIFVRINIDIRYDVIFFYCIQVTPF